MKEEIKNDAQSSQSEKKLGSYKPKRKFLNFVTGIKGRIRFLRTEAYLKGEKLSGMLQGAIFKITICDAGTIDFIEVDTNLSNESMIRRFIEEIDETDVTGYQEKYVVSGLEFQDEDGKPCYLEVEYKKPIDQLFSIFDESNLQNISDVGLSLLDRLFSDFDAEDKTKNEVKPQSVTITKRTVENKENKEVSKYLQEQFSQMNEQKILELKSRIESKEKEAHSTRFDITRSEKKLEKIKEDLRVLETRLASFEPNQDTNGFVFFVSDEQKPEDTGLTEDNRKIADRIAEIVGLKKDVLFKMLTQGYFKIQIAQKGDLESKELKINQDVISSIVSIVNHDNSQDAKITTVSPGVFEYRGTLTWHQLVDRMIKKGFEQDAEFDKLCGSNSYESNEQTDKH